MVSWVCAVVGTWQGSAPEHGSAVEYAQVIGRVRDGAWS